MSYPWDDGLTPEEVTAAWEAMPPSDFYFACLPIEPPTEAILFITPKAYLTQTSKLYEGSDMTLPWLPEICQKTEKSSFTFTGKWPELLDLLLAAGAEESLTFLDIIDSSGYMVPDGVVLSRSV